jgi:hypothetical protein
MIKAIIKTLAISLMLNTVTIVPVSAQPIALHQDNKALVNLNFITIDALLPNWILAVKKNEGYTEANDPSFHKSGPDWDGPQHGYFAVPLIFIGIAGILLFFLGRDKD